MKCIVVAVAMLVILFGQPVVYAQKTRHAKSQDVYVDKQGVLRWAKDGKEAAFFGVNYTVPFAYGYRSHQALGMDLEKAIDQDVYHLSRLGLDAFRVHVWDTEISDSMGNLLANEHLRLFDYLLAQLEKRNINILITPIAFWGNGYPEKDELTPGFSRVYGKGPAVVNEAAIQAQENYLQQFFTHVNPYTHKTYGADRNVIAMEINNEPHHSGAKAKTTDYINRLTKAVKSTGWTKPVFYNISESPTYADAVAAADVDGHSFQWYPTGLVAGHTLQGNYLPNVDRYVIPFIDTIPSFRHRARMVYEFDAGDVLQSNMYPAIARSFRSAGFQWATQFAYDPMATAYANTEYQTHYLNLAYTPSKAISLLIASKAFHQLPRLKSYGAYPLDSTFGVFRVSYKNALSEMNSDTAFYYSNTTQTKAVAVSRLQHIAGVGSSPVVSYSGRGAYFLDKISEGIWRLEVMPDAIHIRDPFEKASPGKEVTRIVWHWQTMQLQLPDIGAAFSLQPLNEGNHYRQDAVTGSFRIWPGTYLLKSKNANGDAQPNFTGVVGLHEFVAPPPTKGEPFVKHIPYTDVSAGKPFTITATVVGIDTGAKVTVEVRSTTNQWKTLTMKAQDAYTYSATVPADMVTPGLISYRIIVQQGQDYYVFPGNHRGNPYAWDNVDNDTWQTFVAAAQTPLQLFNPTIDRTDLAIYNPDWRKGTINYITAEKPGQLVQKLTLNQPAAGQAIGWQLYIADKMLGRQEELNQFTKLVIRARSLDADAQQVKVTLVNKDAEAFSTIITPTGEFEDIVIPISTLQKDSLLLLPRPYPGFQPLQFLAGTAAAFQLDEIEKLQLLFTAGSAGNGASLEVASIWLEK